MSDKPREWIIYDGDEDGPCWNGPQITAEKHVHVIEYSAYKCAIDLLKQFAEYQEWQHEKGKPSLWELVGQANLLVGGSPKSTPVECKHEWDSFCIDGGPINQCHKCGANVEIAASHTECKHEWQRRRDGRWCSKCEKIEFGDIP